MKFLSLVSRNVLKTGKSLVPSKANEKGGNKVSKNYAEEKRGNNTIFQHNALLIDNKFLRMCISFF